MFCSVCAIELFGARTVVHILVEHVPPLVDLIAVDEQCL
jgi:hypothetical protein